MNNTRAALVKKYLQHMRQFSTGAVSKGNMLVSPPGVGKSQFITALASLLGIELVTIEAPHIVEEKLINIPFLVKKPASNTQQQGNTKVQVTKGTAQDEFDIELADSHLFTQLINAQAIPDAQYIQNVYNNANIAMLYEATGGTREQIPQIIKDIRSKYRVILFIDEFWRTPSPTIAAILRSLLNKRLGMHQLPNYAYLTYASNLIDTGDSIAKRQQNQRFNMYHLGAASKEDWFAWLLAKFNNDTSGVKLNMNIINKFGKILKDEDISSDFETTSGDIVRASPRRWEQLILYVNSAFPIKNEQDAKSLITNVQINFLHYLDSEYHPIAKKVVRAVVELIKEVSGITVKESDVNSDTDWRHTLQHQIEMKQVLGDYRSYIPVVSGPPGIGKAQPLHSKIKTPSGWTTMGETEVGDIISTPDGEAAAVTGIYPQGIKPIYKITCADGRTTEACAEHFWTIKKDRESKWQNLTTAQIKETIENTHRWIYLPLVKSLSEDVDLPMNPYLLGCLLGDGSLGIGSIKFSTADSEILDNLQPLLLEHNCEFKFESNYDYRISQIGVGIGANGKFHKKNHFGNPIKQLVFDCGLVGCNSYTKFIPDCYKNASVNQKEALIAGLVDTDGCVGKRGSLSISTSSKQLAEDIQYIVRSIGGIAISKTRHPWFTYKGEKKQGADNYNISIRYPEPKNLSRLSRKRDRLPSDYQYKNLNLRITSVEYIGDCEAQCIMIDHPDHLYITDNFMVTHNTANVAAVAQEMNLRLVVIDASELVDPGEVIGLPAPDTKEGRRSVKFVASKLFKQIYDIIDHEDQRYKTNLIARLGQDAGSQAYAKYEKSRWKYLIFFDELNRAPPQVMNALRRVILEKNFGEKDNMGVEMKLPKEAIVMGAINPTGEGTHELTHHMRDVMDIIPASASWARQKQFLESKDVGGTSPEVRNAIIQAFELISSHFSLKSLDNDKKPFYLDVGGGEGLYITPNDITDMYAAASDSVQSTIDDKLKEYNADRVTDLSSSEIKQLDRDIKEAIYDSFEPSLYDIFHNHDLDGTRWLQTFHVWVLNSNIGEQLTKTSSSKLTSRGDIKSILEQHLGGTASKSLKDDSRFVNYVKSKDHVSVAHEIDTALSAMVKDPKEAKKLIATPSVKQVEYNVETEEFTVTDIKVPPMFNLLTNVGVALSVNGFSGEVFEHIVGNMDELMDKTLSGLLKTKPPLITKEQYTVLYDEGYDIILKLQELA